MKRPADHPPRVELDNRVRAWPLVKPFPRALFRRPEAAALPDPMEVAAHAVRTRAERAEIDPARPCIA